MAHVTEVAVPASDFCELRTERFVSDDVVTDRHPDSLQVAMPVLSADDLAEHLWPRSNGAGSDEQLRHPRFVSRLAIAHDLVKQCKGIGRPRLAAIEQPLDLRIAQPPLGLVTSSVVDALDLVGGECGCRHMDNELAERRIGGTSYCVAVDHERWLHAHVSDLLHTLGKAIKCDRMPWVAFGC